MLKSVSNAPLFETLSGDSIKCLKSFGRSIVLDEGETLFVQGDEGDALFIVESGKIEISTIGSTGKKLTLNVMGHQEVFGEIAALDGGPRTASACALEKTIVSRIARTDILQAAKDRPEIAQELINFLCVRVRWVSQQVEDFGLLGVEGRLAHRLLILDEKFFAGSGVINLSQSELAEFLGATRESVNKILQTWADRELIELSRGTVTILLHDSIEELASRAN